MHHSFFHGFIGALTYQTINFAIIIIQICFQNMYSEESGRTCDHDISQIFLCDSVHIFFNVSADHTLDLVVIVV